MAKSNSIFELQGTVAGLTFVRSRAYGDHLRAKRGTHKKAEVNDAFKEGNKKLLSANVPAKIFKDAIDPYRSNVMGGTLWQRLLSMFRKQLKDFGLIDFGKIERFDVRADYPFDRFLLIQHTITLEKKKSVVDVRIKYNQRPKFKVKDIDGYQLTVIGMFPDLKNKTAKTVAIESSIMSLTGSITPFQAQLEIPLKAKSFIVCIRIEGCEGSVVSNARSTKALCVIGSGTI